jgi:hypothetical protein
LPLNDKILNGGVYKTILSSPGMATEWKIPWTSMKIVSLLRNLIV